MRRLIVRFFSGIILCFVFAHNALATGDPCFDVGVGGTCAIFEDAIVQNEAAEGLIKVALKADVTDESKNGYYVLKGELEETAGRHYLYSDSKNALHVFRFNDFDLPHGIVEKERTSIRNAICTMYGGKSANDSTICYLDDMLTGVQSAYFVNDLKQFGMYPQWVPEKEQRVIGKQTITVAAHYKFNPDVDYDDFDVDDWGFEFDGMEIINPNIFKNLQIRDLSSVKEYLKDYILLRFSMAGFGISNVSCASSTIRVKDKNFAPDDLLPCSVIYYDVNTGLNFEKNIGFLFDDVAETKERISSAGGAIMACVASGGSATQKGVCAGFDKNMCELLKTENGVDVEWDMEKGGCVLLAQHDYNKSQKLKNSAIVAGGVVVGLLTLPVTGGGSAIAVVAIIGGVATAVGTITTATANKIMDVKFTAALLEANKCLISCGGIREFDVDAEVYNYGLSPIKKTFSCFCARSAVENLAKAMVEYEGTFTEQDANTASYLIDVLLSAQTGTMNSICLHEIAENVDKSSWQNVAKIGNDVALIGVILSVSTWFSNSVNSAKTVGDTLTNQFHANAKNAKSVLNAIGKTKKIEKTAEYIRKMALNTVEGMDRILLNSTARGKRLNFFADRLSTIDTGLQSPKSVFAAWAEVCPASPFPCGATLTKFVDNFDDLCGVM